MFLELRVRGVCFLPSGMKNIADNDGVIMGIGDDRWLCGEWLIDL